MLMAFKTMKYRGYEQHENKMVVTGRNTHVNRY